MPIQYALKFIADLEGKQGGQGVRGNDGTPGRDGVNAVANDTANAGYIGNPISLTQKALFNTLGAAPTGFQDFLGRIRNGAQDVSMLFLGDSTGQIPGTWTRLVPERLAAMFTTHTVIRHNWSGYLDPSGVSAGEWESPITVSVGTGPRTIHFWNGSMPGKSWGYMLNSIRTNVLITLTYPDVIVFNNGHNESPASLTDPASWRGNRDRAILAIEQVRALAPTALVVLMAQNPYVDGSGNNLGYSEMRADLYRRIAAERGYGFIDGCTPFKLDGRALGTLISGPHPNTDGFLIWTDEIMRHFRSQVSAQQVPNTTPSLLGVTRQLIKSGDFADFAAPPTLPNWAAAGVVLSHDAIHTESKAYSVKMTKSVSGGSGSISTPVIMPAAMLKRQWVTMVARVWIPSASGNATGQLQLLDQNGILASGTTWDDVRDQWMWVGMSTQIPLSSESLTLRLNLDPTSSADTRTMSVDRVSMVLGRYPIDVETGIGGAPVLASATVDSFDRTNDGTTLGSPWVVWAGVFGISANQAYTPGGAVGQAVRNTGTPDHEASATLTAFPGALQYIGVIARGTNADNYYWAEAEVGGNIRLYMRVTGVSYPLDTATGFSVGDTLTLQASGSELIVKRNGAVVIRKTSTFLPTGNFAGLRQGAASTASRWNDFSFRPL